MSKILTILLVTGLFLPLMAQKPTLFNPNEIKLEWELIQNQYQGKSLALSKLRLLNEGSKDLPSTGWALYFNFVRPVLPEFTRSFGLEIEHLGGDWFRAKLLPGFPGIPRGGKYEVNLVADLWLLNKTDAPNGFYIVFDAEPEKGYALAPIQVVSPARPDRLVRGPEDKAPAATPEVVFQQNETTLNLPLDSLQSIFPTPVLTEHRKGRYWLKSDVGINADPAFKKEAEWLANTLAPLFGKTGKLELRLGSNRRPGISLELAAAEMPPEAYTLEVSENTGVVIRASTPAGAFYGIQSLMTMLPPELWQKPAPGVAIPCLYVRDEPRFAYRGLHVDVARNFQPMAEVLKLLDAMALYKMNKLHFHFSDDEGWRIEIPGLPELTTVGSRRGHSTTESDFLHPTLGSGPAVDTTWGSGHYSRSEFIQILAYASARHIEVIPEIELPGHARAAVTAMRIRRERLLKTGQTAAAEQYNLTDLEDRSVYQSVQYYNDNVVNVGLNSTYTFIEKVLDELLAMYREAGAPISTVHLGGDEVPAGVWEKSPACQKIMLAEGIENSADLWYYFWRKMHTMVQQRGLTLSGWEEVGLRKTSLDGAAHNIPNPDFAADGFQMYVWNNVLGWGAEDLAYQLANAGYKVVLGPVSNMYFDMAYQKDFEEPGYYWGSYTDVDKTFGFVPFDYFKTSKTDRFGNPVDPRIFIGKSRLTDYGKSNIMGLEGFIWSETLQGPATLEYMVFPKILGLAERAWAPAPAWETIADSALFEKAYTADWTRFANQLGKRELPRLDFYSGGFQYRIPTPGAVIRDEKLFANLQLPGFELHYSLDGSAPTFNSPVYSGPIPMADQVKIRAFDRRGRGSRIVSLSSLKGPQDLSDTLGHYSNRQISHDWRLFRKAKSFGGQIIQFQTNYPSGRIAQEYSRYDDSSFLFTAYYEFPDSSVQFRGSTWGIEREGLVRIVPGSLKDTIVAVDPETYDEHYYFDSLLLPAGKWTYFFPDGQVRLTGNYLNYKREGKWSSMDRFGSPEKTSFYHQGTVISTHFDNCMLAANADTSRFYLKGKWQLIAPAADNGSTVNQKFLDYQFLYRIADTWSNNDTYFFKEAKRLEYTKIKKTTFNNAKPDEHGLIVVNDYKLEKEEVGSWSLPAYNLIEITLDKQTQRYRIEYLSDKTMRWNKL